MQNLVDNNSELYLTLISRPRAREALREQDPGNGPRASTWFPRGQRKSHEQQGRSGGCIMQHQEGTAYVTGTADVAEGERRQRLGMGAVSCWQGQHTQVSAPHESLWSGLGERWGLRGCPCLCLEPAPLLVKKPLSEWPVPQFINLFLLEFPPRPLGHQQLKILGLVAKGSLGTVLKVLDCGQKAVFAVKVVPKVKVLQRDTLRQCKDEINIQRRINHPFVHSLGDSWQGKRHLFIMRSYCSADLQSLWSTVGCFAEASVRLFAAELVLVLCYLHDLGMIHRDVKVELNAFCLQKGLSEKLQQVQEGSGD
ncbi:Ribosomal Protein S6 Kinase-Related Protein [Manis pentadactyla]|nr:Ribosomal Protein S6 Kinase-Related Protein [Manis pentadactyla]